MDVRMCCAVVGQRSEHDSETSDTLIKFAQTQTHSGKLEAGINKQACISSIMIVKPSHETPCHAVGRYPLVLPEEALEVVEHAGE